MSLVVPALFVFAAVVSITTIWQAIAANWDTVVDLHHRMRQPHCGAQVTVNLREELSDLDALWQIRRPRQVRVPAPKPITHRLHQFARDRGVA